VNYTSTSSFQVSWEADDCWPSSTITSGKSLDVLNYASVSAYSLEITVLGPRGVSPWPSGNMGSLVHRRNLCRCAEAMKITGWENRTCAILNISFLVIVLSCTGVAARCPQQCPAETQYNRTFSASATIGRRPPGKHAGNYRGLCVLGCNTVRHTPANSCSGLAITVSVGSSSGGRSRHTHRCARSVTTSSTQDR